MSKKELKASKAPKTRDMKPEDIKKVLDTFKTIKPDAKALQAYCARFGLTPMSTDDFEDYEKVQEQDIRNEHIFNMIVGTLMKLKYIPELVSEEEAKKIADENEELQYEIIGKSYELGITYRESDAVFSRVGSFLEAMVKDIITRNGNMAAKALKMIATEKLGDENFTLKQLADYTTAQLEKNKE